MIDDHIDTLPVVLGEGATMPRRAFPGDAGLDIWHVFANDRTVLSEHCCIMPGINVLATGVYIAIPPGHFGKIEGRSGLAVKGCFPVGGVLDSGYRGEIRIILANIAGKTIIHDRSKPIAQLVIYPILTPVPVQVESLVETPRGEGGFGHTDSRS